ncbi:polysaccharide pyruvyl transferase CsaB [Peribacillus muralis]|uniref:polysaccharide pyruvyl transferase CsaB n=1 Tax=Peribacillus muralis TaxID=264697 RepID=UPI000708E863|nr:polysaccharide pyruvyl transferase CsaB [Peribacillus muralis]
MTKVLVFGYYGDKNLGDEILLQGILTSFKLENPSLDVTILSKNPKLTSERFNIKSTNAPRKNKYLLKFIREISKTDIFILGGGGLIQDFIGIKQLFYWISSLLIAKIFRKKTMLYSIGVGPLGTKQSRIVTRFFLKFADLITVRDEGSADLLLEIGVRKDKIFVTADPAFVLNPEIKKNKISIRENSIGISFLPYFNIVNNNSMESELELNFIKFINQLIETQGYNVYLIPLHNLEGETHDLGAAKRILAGIKNKEKILLLDEDLTPTEALNIFGEFEIFVGVRLHSLIMSAINNVPFVSINYHPKVESFIKLVNQERYSLNINNVTDEELMEKFLLLKENKQNEIKTIKNEFQQLRKKSLSTQTLLRNFINKD